MPHRIQGRAQPAVAPLSSPRGATQRTPRSRAGAKVGPQAVAPYTQGGDRRAPAGDPIPGSGERRQLQENVSLVDLVGAGMRAHLEPRKQ